jgi:hypothetical protein
MINRNTIVDILLITHKKLSLYTGNVLRTVADAIVYRKLDHRKMFQNHNYNISILINPLS